MKTFLAPAILIGVFALISGLHVFAGFGGNIALDFTARLLSVFVFVASSIFFLIKWLRPSKRVAVEFFVVVICLYLFYQIPSKQLFLAGLNLKLHMGNRIPILTKAADNCFKDKLPLSEGNPIPPSFAQFEYLAVPTQFGVSYVPDTSYIVLRWWTSWDLVQIIIAKDSSTDAFQDFSGNIQKATDRMWITF